uniref:Protein kinase domain-containing protein n=1 Tax=Romanomermis culicivorax TaxID=13658 RepID=A0A915JJZ7_ROMCU
MKDLDPCLAENEVVVDRFLVVDLLGSGSFGQIYRVLDRRNNLFAAIKVEIRHSDLKRDKLPMELNVLKILRTANRCPVTVTMAQLPQRVKTRAQDNLKQKGDSLYVLYNKIEEFRVSWDYGPSYN